MILRLTWSAGMSGATERMRATAPVDVGAAIEVPLSSPYSRPGSVLRMSFPARRCDGRGAEIERTKAF